MHVKCVVVKMSVKKWVNFGIAVCWSLWNTYFTFQETTSALMSSIPDFFYSCLSMKIADDKDIADSTSNMPTSQKYLCATVRVTKFTNNFWCNLNVLRLTCLLTLLINHSFWDDVCIICPLSCFCFTLWRIQTK